MKGKATGGDAVSDSVWQWDGKEWFDGFSGDGSNDDIVMAGSYTIVG